MVFFFEKYIIIYMRLNKVGGKFMCECNAKGNGKDEKMEQILSKYILI